MNNDKWKSTDPLFNYFSSIKAQLLVTFIFYNYYYIFSLLVFLFVIDFHHYYRFLSVRLRFMFAIIIEANLRHTLWYELYTKVCDHLPH